MAARLEALENDVAVQDTFAAGSDDEEFVLREDSEGGKKKFCRPSFIFCYFFLLNLCFPLSKLPFLITFLKFYRRRRDYRL